MSDVRDRRMLTMIVLGVLHEYRDTRDSQCFSRDAHRGSSSTRSRASFPAAGFGQRWKRAPAKPRSGGAVPNPEIRPMIETLPMRLISLEKLQWKFI